MIRSLLASSLLVLATGAGAAVDLSGEYVVEVDGFFVTCRLSFVQTGNRLTINGPCGGFGVGPYTYDLAGIVYDSGDFAARGQLSGLCEDPPLRASMQGKGDGEEFTATGGCDTLLLDAVGTKCGNGTVDSTEDCEDGNTEAGDCCSPRCLYEPPFSSCAADRNDCTLDACDGLGRCVHPVLPAGAPCGSDANQCTDDVCNGAGGCTHPERDGPCDDENACTEDDACSAGVCVGGAIAQECVGSVDLSGFWDVMPVSGFGLFGPGAPLRLEQSDAVLRSIGPDGDVGIGSVDPSTGTFVSITPFTAMGIAPCIDKIEGSFSA